MEKRRIRPIEYDWKGKSTSVVWESPDLGIVRIHSEGDTDYSPLYHGVVVVKVGYKWKWLHRIITLLQKVNRGDLYEFKAMVFNPPKQTKEEHKEVKQYLKSLGLSGFSRRLGPDGEIIIKRY